MDKNKASAIAGEFLDKMNPERWNGHGARPDSLNEKTWGVPVEADTRLDLGFEYDKDCGWSVLAELVDTKDNTTYDISRAYTICDTAKIAEAIEDLCAGL